MPLALESAATAASLGMSLAWMKSSDDRYEALGGRAELQNSQALTLPAWPSHANREDCYCDACFLSSATSFAVSRDGLLPKRAVT